MRRQSYYSGDFSTYAFKYVNKTFHFAKNPYFGHNERRFRSNIHSGVKSLSRIRLPATMSSNPKTNSDNVDKLAEKG